MSSFYNWLQENQSESKATELVGNPPCNRKKHFSFRIFLGQHKISTAIIGLAVIGANVALFVAYPRITETGQIVGTGEVVKAAEPVDISQFGLEIDRINARAPIIPGIDIGDTAEYLKALENGLALSKDSAANPAVSGNMFVFGHSEYYKKKPGNYKEIFKSLNQVKAGDIFTVYYKGTAYQYEVTESKIVASDDFSILDQTLEDSGDKTITLMTCWPPGTTENRWVVFAKQISSSDKTE